MDLTLDLDASSPPDNWKIMPDKIHEISCDDSSNDKAQILIFHKTSRNFVQSLKVENFPRVFVILIDFEEEIDEFLELIAEKFTNRALLVQIKNENSLNFYIKRENSIKKVESATVDTKTAESYLSNLKTSIIEANFSQFTSNFDKSRLSHCQAIESDDDFYFRLLNLFDDNFSVEMQCKIFLSVIKSDNFNFFLAFLNIFELQGIYEPGSDDLLHDLTEKLEKVLCQLILKQDVENFKSTIKYLSSFKLFSYQNSNIYQDILELVVKCELIKFYELLKNEQICYKDGMHDHVLEFAAKFCLEETFKDILKTQAFVYHRSV